MAKGSLRRYDVQAKWSLYISIAGCAAALALLVLIVRNFRSELNSIVYNIDSMYKPLVLLVTAVAGLLAATGWVMGIVSAGQRRNQLTRWSWTAFFLSTFTISMIIILFAAFQFLNFPVR